MNGDGRFALAAVRLAVVESLLPSLTFHDGPPSYTPYIYMRKNHEQQQLKYQHTTQRDDRKLCRPQT
ncbi:hypothetical protein Hanom_Chr10g00895001 [Helianthus anomalus]